MSANTIVTGGEVVVYETTDGHVMVNVRLERGKIGC